MENAAKEFSRFLKTKGLRNTPERLAILREVMASGGHFEAEDIFLRLRANKPKVSQTSIFRTLNLLVEAGMVHKTLCDRMGARYEAVFGIDHHDHLVCIRCGRVIEFKEDAIEKLQEKVARKHHFRLVGHRLVLSGYCERCR